MDIIHTRFEIHICLEVYSCFEIYICFEIHTRLAKTKGAGF